MDVSDIFPFVATSSFNLHLGTKRWILLLYFFVKIIHKENRQNKKDNEKRRSRRRQTKKKMHPKPFLHPALEIAEAQIRQKNPSGFVFFRLPLLRKADAEKKNKGWRKSPFQSRVEETSHTNGHAENATGKKKIDANSNALKMAHEEISKEENNSPEIRSEVRWRSISEHVGIDKKKPRVSIYSEKCQCLVIDSVFQHSYPWNLQGGVWTGKYSTWRFSHTRADDTSYLRCYVSHSNTDFVQFNPHRTYTLIVERNGER